MLCISEIFYSLQGEGIYTNIPMVFIRFSGCNLLTPCQYCDTLYARDGSKGIEKSIAGAAREAHSLDPHHNAWTCITGGEPLSQPDVLYELVRTLKKTYGRRITVETNGSLPLPKWYTIVDSWNADIKCPSSGVCSVSKEEWFKTRVRDQIKFVVGTKEDLDFARGMIKKHAADSPVIIVSPVSLYPSVPNDAWDEGKSKLYTGDTVFDTDWLQEVAEFCKEMRVRIGIQQQKIIWGTKRGV